MADLTRSAGEGIIYKTSGGQEFILSPITIGDLAAFESFAKGKRMLAFLEASRQAEMSKEDRMSGIARIIAMPYTPDDFTSEMASMGGVRFLLHRSIQKKYPKFTIEEVDAFDDMDEIMTALTAISSLGRIEEAAEIDEDMDDDSGPPAKGA